MKAKLPAFVLKRWRVRTTRAWKSAKRKEFRLVEKALDRYRIACAYAPGYPHIVERLDFAMKDLKQALTVKEWGR